MLNLQKVQPVEEDVLQSIMQFYIYEFSKYIPTISLGENGQYDPFNLKKYWDNDNFHAFFVKLEDELIGFVLIEGSKVSSPNTIKEFFIMAKHSGKGYGKEIAKKLFNMFPGFWKITQIENNKSAHAFWHKVVKEFTNGSFMEFLKDGKFTQEFNTIRQ
ncbi:GNAT family N-acetyltransferase [Oceanobacillus jordanicus]|nr:GNAT family N-acetyltransferase [Oceanobacillus jordanicus]